MLPSKLGISEEDNVFNKLYMINCNSLWICLFGEDWPAIPRSVKKWVVFRVPSNDIFALVNMFEGQSTWHFQLLWILWVMSHFTLPTVVLESDSLSLFLDFRNAQKTHTLGRTHHPSSQLYGGDQTKSSEGSCLTISFENNLLMLMLYCSKLMHVNMLIYCVSSGCWYFPCWFSCWNWSIKHVYCMFVGTCNRLSTYLRQ